MRVDKFIRLIVVVFLVILSSSLYDLSLVASAALLGIAVGGILAILTEGACANGNVQRN